MKKIKALLYCTKAKPYLWKYWFSGDNGNGYNYEISLSPEEWKDEGTILNGKIVAECEIEVEEITYAPNPSAFERANFSPKEWGYDYQEKYGGLSNEELLKHSCLTNKELSDYLNTPTNDKKVFCEDTFGYAIHIKNLHIFDKPRELKDCLIHPKIEPRYYGCEHLSKAPQNMMYVELDDIKYILISIQPQELCRILNGEQTILIKKQVLNCMKGNK